MSAYLDAGKYELPIGKLSSLLLYEHQHYELSLGKLSSLLLYEH